ncbi:MAG TPA: VOC family protein [Aridibacter sp.]|nr:VOC family protein [Aridibacter sp.]
MKAHLDHIHVYVSDQYEAAEWYEKVLGLKILRDLEGWTAGGGPLTISGDGGNSGVALFARDPEKSDNQSTVAFGVSGEDFAEFIGRLPELRLAARRGGTVTADDISDHSKSWSIYFSDPYGNPIEVTTGDYEFVKDRLGLS